LNPSAWLAATNSRTERNACSTRSAPGAQVATFLGRRTEMSETHLVRAFRAWVRDQMARGWQPPA
jgi:hypothetical protein